TDRIGPYPGRHRYIMLCAADEHGHEYTVENEKGLHTAECLEFLSSIPRKNYSKFFTYSFGYDLTKILEDVEDRLLYRLVRPELRRAIHGTRKLLVPIYWPTKAPQYSLNWMNGRFSLRKLKRVITVADPQTGGPRLKYEWGPTLIIHDVWRFFQGKFTVALEDWKVPDGDPKERKVILDRMREMKDKRANFDQLTREEIR